MKNRMLVFFISDEKVQAELFERQNGKRIDCQYTRYKNEKWDVGIFYLLIQRSQRSVKVQAELFERQNGKRIDFQYCSTSSLGDTKMKNGMLVFFIS